MTLEQAIKKRLTDLCQEQNISLADLGIKSKVDPAITDGIQAGAAEATLYRTIVLFCEGLGIEIPDFFCNDTFRNLEHS